MFERINNDIILAMKSQNKEVLSTLRSVKASLQLEKTNKKEMTDELVIDIISKQIKLRKESIIEFSKANRSDLIESYQQEIDILMSYLPPQMTDEEVRELIINNMSKIEVTSINDFGKVMKEISPLIKGKYDMSKASMIIKDIINNL